MHLLLTFSNGGRSSLSYDFNKNKLSLLPVFLGLCLSSPFDYNNNIKNFKTMFTLRPNDSNHVVYLKPSKLCGSSHSPMLTIHKESCKYKWHWHPCPWALVLKQQQVWVGSLFWALTFLWGSSYAVLTIWFSGSLPRLKSRVSKTSINWAHHILDAYTWTDTHEDEESHFFNI